MLRGADSLPTISTERLRLRWLTPDDVPALASIFGDPEVCRFWSSPALSDLAAAEALHSEIVRGFVARAAGLTEPVACSSERATKYPLPAPCPYPLPAIRNG